MSSPADGALLAKGRVKGSRDVSLLAHSLDVDLAASILLGRESRFGRALGRFFRIAEEDHERLLLHVRVAALLHDIGKANADFQAAVRYLLDGPQTLRHEHISALVLHLPEVRSWLCARPDLDVAVVTAAVLSHHIKAAGDGDWRWAQPRGKASLELHMDHADVVGVLERVSQLLGLPSVPRIGSERWAGTSPWFEAREEGIQAAKVLRRSTRHEGPRASLLLAVKAGLIIADSAASGLIREGHPLAAWLEDVANAERITDEEIVSAVLEPRGKQIEEQSGKPFFYHAMQRHAAQLGPRSLLLAGCGSGKTLAAWKWAEAQARTKDIGKVVFLYPTRATATEGFRDYVAWAPEGKATLLSGTARYELEAMAKNPPEALHHKRVVSDEGSERLYAIGFWRYRFFSSTIDQFLSFLEHQYRGLCLLPVLADAAVIIDEVHSFDSRMFEDLIALLKTFDVPILCMTATLPPDRREQLESAGMTTYPTPEELAKLADLEEMETRPRYRLELGDSESAFRVAVEAWRLGQRVLCVVNQVARAQDLTRRLAAELDVQPLCYHSGFRLCDRQTRHNATVAAFRPGAARALGVTTQVCEMSLDLDADVLITELAPVTSLVQRFGRANRHAHTRKESFRARIVVVEPDNALPYDQRELAAARAFVKEAIAGGDASQRSLALGLQRHAPQEPLADGSARFLEGGYFATPGSLRDIDGHKVSAVLDSDLEVLRERLAGRSPYDDLICPVPRRWALDDAERPSWMPRHLSVAPSDQYSVNLGFQTQEAEP